MLCAADLSLKSYIESHLRENEERHLCGGRLRIRKYHNYGVAFNLLEKKPKLVRLLASVMTGGVVGCILRVFGQKGRYGEKAGLALLLGGACSNLYDRFVRGYVVDYFSFQSRWRRLAHTVFNLGDLYIFAGGMLAALLRNPGESRAVREGRPER